MRRVRRFPFTLALLSVIGYKCMATFSTREAAEKLGISLMSLQRYIAARKIQAPKLRRLGKVTARLWSASDIEKVRKQLPKIANGRKKRKGKK